MAAGGGGGDEEAEEEADWRAGMGMGGRRRTRR
jgi:hypothetical protein